MCHSSREAHETLTSKELYPFGMAQMLVPNSFLALRSVRIINMFTKIYRNDNHQHYKSDHNIYGSIITN